MKSRVALLAALSPGLVGAGWAAPSGGDQRWRPALRNQAAPEDNYVTLVPLQDGTGKYDGDAVAFIELKQPALRGGRVLYARMRTPQALGVDSALLAIFRFVEEKLGRTPMPQ